MTPGSPTDSKVAVIRGFCGHLEEPADEHGRRDDGDHGDDGQRYPR